MNRFGEIKRMACLLSAYPKNDFRPRQNRPLAHLLALVFVGFFCVGSATTQRVQREEPVDWTIHLEEGSTLNKQRCINPPQVKLLRGSPPLNAKAETRFRLDASRPQSLENFETQLMGTAQAWCMARVSLLRAEMVDGQFLAEKVWAVTWQPPDEDEMDTPD